MGAILVVVDTLRADHVGLYGSDRGLTPNLDRLGTRSHVFENAIAPSSWTRPSLAALLTSRLPTAVGVLDKEDVLAEGALLLSEVLRERAGLRTLAISTNGNTTASFGFAQGYDVFVEPHLKRSYPDDFPIPIAEGVTQKALQLLDDLDEDERFFLLVHYVDPHDPYLPHPGLLEQPEPLGRFDGSRRQLHEMDRIPVSEQNEADRERIGYLYQGEVKYCDLWIGKLLEGLEARDLLDRTMLVVAADHGEGLWDHGFRRHGIDLHEETVRVPLIVHYPGMSVAEATRISMPVSLTDVSPTILAAFDVPPPDVFQGSDLRRLIDGAQPDPPQVYSEMDHKGRSYDATWSSSSKLIRNRRPRGGSVKANWQLFDLARDPHETVNLIRRRPEDAEKLRAILEQHHSHLARSAPDRLQTSDEGLSDETIASLRALGYLADDQTGSADHRGEGSRPDDEANSGSDGAAAPVQDRELGAVYDRTTIDMKRSDPAKTKWSIECDVDLSGAPGSPITVSVRVDSAEPTTVAIHESGRFTLEGPLPPPAGEAVLLEIDCARLAPPSRSRSSATASACLRLRAARLD